MRVPSARRTVNSPRSGIVPGALRTVSAADGRAVIVSYVATDGVPTARKRSAVFPIGTGAKASQFVLTYRDLATDVGSAFGIALQSVEQVRMFGKPSASSIMLATPEFVGDAMPVPSDAIDVPLSGWFKRGRGEVFDCGRRVRHGHPLRTGPGGPFRGIFRGACCAARRRPVP